ncbi:hypothetical protein CGK60_18525, partial [Vibrio parahaemolyticus]
MWRFSKNNALPNTDNKKSADEKYVG